MSRHWMRIAGMVGAMAIVGCGEAPAQRRHTNSTYMHVDTDPHGGRIEISVQGEVEFGDDDRSVARLSPDGRITLAEERPGQPRRRVEYRPGEGGGVQMLFYRDGDRRAPDAGDRAWIDRMITRAVRGGAGAERRVARIRDREGTDGVLREIERIEGDGGRRAHYRALLRTPGLSGGETARTLRHLGRHLRSDGEKRVALSTALEGSPDAEELAAILDAAATINSDGDRSGVLARVAREHSLDDARVRTAFFRAAGGIDSDGDLSRVLLAELVGGGARGEVLAAALRASDGISSDGDLSRVLLAVLRHPEAGADVVASAVRASERISSDGDRARVLIAVPDRALRTAPVRAAVHRSLQGIRSGGDRERVERRLARSQS
jgi:hypothetical protein